MNGRYLILCFVAACALLAADAHADLISGPDIIAAPGSVIDDAPGAENTNQQAFNEAQNVLLLADLNVDGPTDIAAGLVVDSAMIFLNTPVGGGNATDMQTWSFDGLILGVMSDSTGAAEVASSSFLGAPGTTYPLAPFNARGMEGGDAYLVTGNTIRVRMSVSEPGDWIRVVTAAQPVPEPSAIVLVGLGATVLILRRRRRQRKQAG